MSDKENGGAANIQQLLYHTVNSQKSIGSNDSGANRVIPFLQGSILFDDRQQRLRQSSYIRVSADTDLDEIVKYVSLKWFKRSPKIILSLITGLCQFTTYKNQKQLNKFKRGIIKAAYSTDLVYVTNGYNIGISKLIGDAFREESLATRGCSESLPLFSSNYNDTVGTENEQLDKLMLIGIVSTSNLRLADEFRGGQELVVYKIQEQDSAPNSELFSLNPDHTHFILVDDEGIIMKFLKFRVAFEKRLQRPVIYRNKLKRSTANLENMINDESMKSSLDDKIPLVNLLIGGGVGALSVVLTKLHQGLPILVFKGTGHAPDLISGAYEDFADRENLSDNHLRTALTTRITEKFPKESKDDSTRNKIKDNLLQILKYSRTESGHFLTFLDCLNSDLDEMDKHILISLLQSQPGPEKSKELLKKYIMPLVLDWNRPEIASAEIFQHDSVSKIEVDKLMFEKALLKKNREDFIEIFLDQGFQIHHFLNHIKMFMLFEKCEDREFFLTVCIGKGLGTKLTQDDFDEMRLQPPRFFQKYINPLVKKLSDIDEFYQILEMSLNALKLYVEESEFIAERKAIVYLIVFAVLVKRHKLAKILWKRTDQPICVALLCSMMYKRLALLCHEIYIKNELEEYSKDFSRYAIGVLDLSFAQSDLRVYDVLNQKNPDLNDLTVIELAYNSNNKEFLGHACCQIWITKKFYGSIDIRELSFGLFTVPTWIKILSCAFFIFPMYLWIVFPIKRKNKNLISDQNNDSDRDEQDEPDDQEEEKMIRTELMNISTKKPDENLKGAKAEILYVSPSLWEKIFLLWSAPITKFWINLLFYIIYLSLFGLAALWPSCGNLVVDTIVWVWTSLICCETARRTYNKYVMGSNLPLKFSCLEIIIILVFLIFYLFIRILGTWHFDVLTSKSILCLGLIYFYYRSVFVYLPISPTLGPMLVKMKYMIRFDFITFLRMFIVFMAAGGITINAIVYPYYPLNSELIKRVFLRAIFGLFITEKEDLYGKECSFYNSLHHRQCSNKDRIFFNPNGTINSQTVKYSCPYPSAIGWAILIQYLFLVKLFLTTLLTAMFSHTKAKVDAESDLTWMFQRYEIVIDYDQRLRLPPPLNIISYMIMLVQWMIRFNIKKFNMNVYKEGGSGGGSAPSCANKLPEPSTTTALKMMDGIRKMSASCLLRPYSSHHKKQVDHSLYWKIIVQDYAKNLDESAREKDLHKEQVVGLLRLREDFQSQKRNLKRLDDRMVTVERNLTTIQVTVEYLKHYLTHRDAYGFKTFQVEQHIMSRQSPYPFTTQSRFPVFDKYVSWDVFYDLYDPPSIVVDKSLIYSDKELNLIDPDELNLIELLPTSIEVRSKARFGLARNESSDRSLKQHEEHHATVIDESSQPNIQIDDLSVHLDCSGGTSQLETQRKVIEKWNKITTCIIDNKRVIINRSSWINKNGKSIKYLFDSMGYPLNPMGRTGARGRGALWRWGPNHSIRVIVTRWRKSSREMQKNQSTSGGGGMASNRFMQVDGRRMLEFLACKDPQFGEWKLPGGKIMGDVSLYNVACTLFHEEIFERMDLRDLKNSLVTEEDMRNYFATYSIQSQSDDQPKGDNSNRFMGKRIYKGYRDDPRNTDNAWIESEIWNFHYGDQDNLDEFIPNASSKWKEVSSHVRLFGHQNVILKEVANLHQAYY